MKMNVRLMLASVAKLWFSDRDQTVSGRELSLTIVAVTLPLRFPMQVLKQSWLTATLKQFRLIMIHLTDFILSLSLLKM